MHQTAHQHDSEYNDYLATLSLPNEALFTTGIDLWPIYLDSFADPIERQYHNCHACRQFIQRFGTLVAVNSETGVIRSAVWHPGKAPLPHPNPL